MEDLLDRARAWMAADPDPSTRAELRTLIETGDVDELAERMDGTLAFGTAGLRGAVEAGSNRMNRASVIRTTRGLAEFLLDRHGGVPPGPVVVGRDARLSSHRFMRAHGRGPGGCRSRGAVLGGRGSHPAGRLRGLGTGRLRRHSDHRQPQPSPGQRLQGLRRQTEPRSSHRSTRL